MPKKYRFNLELPGVDESRLAELLEATGAASRTEVIRRALENYSALVSQSAEGNRIYVGKDRSHITGEIIIPNLGPLRSKRE
ncbi:MAG: ribbon-helix-helix protein, CopG family [Nanoarchaeota archaeon]